MAGIDAYQDNGAVIDSVEIFAQPGAPQAETSLNVDGYIVANQPYPNSHMVLYPNRQLVVGQNFNQMSLGLHGILYIDHITVNLRIGGYYPPPPPPYGDVVVNGSVNQAFYGNVTLDLLRYVNLYNYRGYRIESVTIHGRNLDSRGSARLLVNGIVAGRVNLSYSGDQIQMPINVSVGQNLQSLELQVVAAAEIDGIEINLTQF
jgi:hypothetical protein